MNVSEKLRENLNLIKAIGSWMAFLTYLVGIGVVIWRGGELAKIVEIDHLDIQALKVAGTPSLRAHEAMDTERINNLAQRLEKLERACEAFAQMQKDISEVKVAVEFLSGRRTGTPINRPMIGPDGKPTAGGYSY